MKLKKFLIGGLLAIAGFASVFAIIQPNINGWTSTTSITPSSAYIITQDGTTQRRISAENFANSITGVLGLSGFLTGYTETDPIWNSVSGNYLLIANSGTYYTNNPLGYITGAALSGYITGYTETDPVFLAQSGGYYPLAGNSISNPVTGNFYMDNGTGSYTIEIGTTNMIVGTPTDVEGPIISPVSYVPGMGPFPIMVTKGWTLFLGEPGQDTQMFITNADTNFGTTFAQKHDEAKFSILINSGGLMSHESQFDFLNDGRIQAHPDPSSVISDDGDFITKGYLDSAIDTGDFVTVGTYADNQTIIGNKDFSGFSNFEGGFDVDLTWMGFSNSGINMDERGLFQYGFSCSDFGDDSLINRSCIEAMITGASFDYLPLSGNTELTAISGDVYLQPARTLQRGEVGVLNGYINYSDVSKEISMNSYELSTNKNGFISIQDGYPQIGYSHDGSFRFVKLQTGGLVYQSDYSGDYTDRSLVDKGYVDTSLTDYVTMDLTGSWNDSYSRIQTYSGQALLWNYVGGVLFPTVTATSYGFRVGYQSLAVGSNAIAIGRRAVSTGDDSVAIGTLAKNAFTFGVALGYQSETYGFGNTSIGVGNKTHGDNSTAVGSSSTASGDNSVALGNNAFAYEEGAVAIGYGINSKSRYGVSMGKFNEGLTGAIFELGDGTSGTPHNAITVLSGGNMGIGTSTPGAYKLSVKSDSLSIDGIYSEAYDHPGYFVQTGGGVGEIGVISEASVPFKSYINNDNERNSYNRYSESQTNDGWAMIHDIPGNSNEPFAITRKGLYSSAMSGGLYIANGSTAMGIYEGSRQIVLSGNNLSFQVYTGGAWVEKYSIAP